MDIRFCYCRPSRCHQSAWLDALRTQITKMRTLTKCLNTGQIVTQNEQLCSDELLLTFLLQSKQEFFYRVGATPRPISWPGGNASGLCLEPMAPHSPAERPTPPLLTWPTTWLQNTSWKSKLVNSKLLEGHQPL